MADASLVVTAGSGTNIHTDTRSYSGTTKHDQYVLPAEYDLASYSATANAISTATANSHLIELMAGSSLNVRVRYILVSQRAAASAAASGQMQLMRLTTAGTGGTAITPAKMDTADSAAGATAMTLATAKGTESTVIHEIAFPFTATDPASAVHRWEWYQKPGMKPIIIAAGTSNGLCLKGNSAVASASVTIYIEFVETSFV